MADPFTVLIMAAGQGTRMRSALPKVLHPVCGKPMVGWVIDAARGAGAQRVVCVVRPGDGVAEALPDGVEAVAQHEGEGTGAAILAAREQLEAAGGPVIVLSGDHPLVAPEHLSGLIEGHAESGAAATILTTDQLDPAGYGRIVRADDGSVERIVETKYPDALPDEVLAIKEVNLGTYVFDAGELFTALDEVELDDQGERYLTAAIPVLRERGGKVATHLTADTDSSFGVNDRVGLMEAEAAAQRRIIERHALAGVSFLSPASTRVSADAEIGPDTTIGLGVTLGGSTRIGSGCAIGPHATVLNSRVADGATVLHSHLVDAEVQEGAMVGPFAYLRPGAVVGRGAKVGTFVEVKNSNVGAGAKVPHLSYVGDADIGDGANLGAGTITANYDGRSKHRTRIEDGVKTGIHTSLVAPVTVGERAYTGAGSVITGDVPPAALGIARAEQKNVEGYADRMDKESE